MSNDPLHNYDSWLEVPYIRAEEQAERAQRIHFDAFEEYKRQYITPQQVRMYTSDSTHFYQHTIPEEGTDMSWVNSEAADIAREILQDEKREGLREQVAEAVTVYREMLKDASCGSVFSFMKRDDDGGHYWYAAVKSGGKWYTTARDPRILEDDDRFITWLISLDAHRSEASELTQGAALTSKALGPIDTTAVDS